MKKASVRPTKYKLLGYSQNDFLHAWADSMAKRGLDSDYIDCQEGSVADNWAINFDDCQFGRISRRYCLGIGHDFSDLPTDGPSDTLLVFTDSDKLLGKFLAGDYGYFLKHFYEQRRQAFLRKLAAVS